MSLSFGGKVLVRQCEVCRGSGTTGKSRTIEYRRYYEDCPNCKGKGKFFTKAGQELRNFIKWVNDGSYGRALGEGRFKT